METINSVANAAAKAVWGGDDSEKEPVSGVQGDVSKGEPYDAGNMEAEDQKKVESSMDSDPKNANPAAEPAPVDATNKDDAKDVTADSKDVAADSKDSSAKPEEGEVELNGAGPKPLAEVAKAHNGDAGNDGVDTAAPADESKDGEEEDKSANQGTGEEYVKTTGLAADGGDFDATKPGAGQEADRLMEEKGMHREVKKDAPTAEGDSSNTPKKDKPSLGDRIKAKLHKH